MAKCSIDNLPRAPYKCYREAEEGDSGVCCSACVSGWHTAACDLRTFPTVSGAEYISSPTREMDLLVRLQKAMMLAGMLAEEFNLLRNVCRGFSIRWEAPLESLLAHLSIDLSYLKAEVKRLTGV